MFAVIEIADDKVLSVVLREDEKEANRLAIDKARENGISLANATNDILSHSVAGEMGSDQYAVWVVKVD